MLSNPLVVHTHDWPRARKFIFSICLVAFLMQLYKITVNYYKYETEFQTKHIYERNDRLDLPAITLCTEFEVLFLKSTLNKRYPTIKSELERIDNSSVGSLEKGLLRESVYRRYASRDYKQIFLDGIKHTDFVECFVVNPTVWMNKKNWNLMSDCSALSDVMESWVNSYGKCFTFFSKQQPDIKGETDLQIDLKGFGDLSRVVVMALKTDKFEEAVKFPLSSLLESQPKTTVHIFIHDSYQMPNFDLEAIELKPGKIYDIQFWAERRSLLKPPYRSNCYDYHKNLLSKELPKSKDQCKHDCYIEKSGQQLNCLFPIRRLTNDFIQKKLDLSRCHRMDFLSSIRRIINQCEQWCHQSCHNTEYKFQVKTTDFKSNEMRVSFDYKRGNDFEYRERPVQTMCDTIQRIFITLVIWFGLSIFSFTSIFEVALNKARPQMYFIFEDKVSPNVVPVMSSTQTANSPAMNGSTVPIEPMIRPKFIKTNIGSNVKLEHYNEFISKVVDGYPTAHTVELPAMKSAAQY